MAKLIKKKYYDKNGNEKINHYLAYIPTSIAEESGLDKSNNIKVYVKDGKIIIENAK